MRELVLKFHQRVVHFVNGLISTGQFIVRGFEEDFGQLLEPSPFVIRHVVERDGSSLQRSGAEAGFAQDFAEAVDIRPRSAGAFGRSESFGSELLGIAPSLGDVSDEPDVRQLGDAVYIDDVRGLDVAMDELLRVEVTKRFAEFHAEVQTFLGWKATASVEFVRQCSRGVGGWLDATPAFRTIRQFHDVVEEASAGVAPDV